MALAAALVWVPAVPTALHDPARALGGVPDLALLVLLWLALARLRPAVVARPAVRRLLLLLWSVGLLFGLSWAASLVATDERLPLYDLLLLLRPLWVFGADLYGPLAPWGVALALALLGAALVALADRAWERLGRLEPPAAYGVGAVACVGLLAGTVTSGPWSPAVVADLAESAALHAQVRSQIEARADLADRRLAARPDVRLYVVESYGDVALEAGDLQPELTEIGGALEAAGWSIASGRATSPTHGGRSWLSDATVLTGIEVARQATFGHVTAMGRTIPSLPRFFAERGYATVLVRPKDRARPGVRLVNHFGFETTVFHDDLGYTGPAVGWGHIPDQYTIEVTEQDVIRPLQRPVFAFFHLATAHVPWGPAPEVREDARDWQLVPGDAGLVQPDRKPWFVLGMELSRFRSNRRSLPKGDSADDRAFLDLVAYDLRVLARTFAEPPRPTLMLWYGDHQPPFIAEGAPPNTVVHVLATDERWLAPFLERGFVRGLDPGPRGRVSLQHRDLFERITAALADPADRGAPP